ncbi:hypothetical protein EJB05_13852, partial [Eragrostis curvula]
MYTHMWSAALACAAPGCDHLDCDDDGAFRVVVVALESFGSFTATFVYSSEQEEGEQRLGGKGALNYK